MPGVHQPEQDALEVNVVACVEHVAGDEAARHEQGHGADRQQEEHRNENQLGGHGAGAHARAFTRRRDEESGLSSPKRVMRGHPDMHTVSPSSRREGVL
jgi:hypothetical protein